MKYPVIIIFLLIIFNTGFSCSFTPKSFCTTINTNNLNNVVLRGYFSATLSNGMIFTRLETLRGDEERDQVSVWDNHPFDCNGWHFRLASYMGNMNEEVIISINTIDADSLYFEGEEPGDYRVPYGLYWETHSLQVDGDSITGHLFPSAEMYPDDESIHYDDFIKNMFENTSCAVTSTNEREEGLVKIYPTLTRDYISLDYNLSLNNSTTMIYDVNGRMVMSSRISPNIYLGLLEKGMYIIVVQTRDNICYHQTVVKI